VKPPLYFLYLDRYHQGDPLFQKELAQRFARTAPGEPPALLLHGAGEKLERTLEAEGLFPERKEGVLVTETPRQQALAERAAREVNQELVALFTEEQVSVVGLQGADRGLLRVAGGNEHGGDGNGNSENGSAVEAGALGWVEDLIKMRVLPVVSALAEGPERVQPVSPARAAQALAGALAASFEVTPCVLATGDLPDADSVAAGALPGEAVSEPGTTRRLAEARGHALLADLDGFFAEGGPQGVRLEAS
jgi:hypothetical protein